MCARESKPTEVHRNRFLMGSVSEAVARHAPCTPVLETLEGRVSEKHYQKVAVESRLLKVLTQWRFGGRKTEVLRSHFQDQNE
jgi:hypothetical protein